MNYTFHANNKLSPNLLFYLNKIRITFLSIDVCVMHIATDKFLNCFSRDELLPLIEAGEFLKGKIPTVVLCNRH